VPHPKLILEKKDNHNTIVPALLGIEPNIIKLLNDYPSLSELRVGQCGVEENRGFVGIRGHMGHFGIWG
jgi:hypothetical protein